MKPSELEENGQKNLNGNTNFSGYATIIRIYEQYKDRDCVIAYRKCYMGKAFVIKGANEMFGFIILNQYLNRYGTGVQLLRKNMSDMKRLFNVEGNESEKVVVVDVENFKIFERKVLYENIEKNNG